MSRRTLRGPLPTTETVLASGTVEPQGSVPSSTQGRPPSNTPLAKNPTDSILLRGEEANRAKRLDLVAGTDLNELGAVGPWAQQLDDERESARASGFQQGRQEGLAAGLEAARYKTQQHLDGLDQHRRELGETVEAVINGLNGHIDAFGEDLAQRATSLALEIARAVLDREVQVSEDPGAEAIARCLELAPTTGCLSVQLNPEDAERLSEIPNIGAREFVVNPDPHLASGDTIITVDDLVIDGRLSEALRRVEEALR